MVKLFVSNTSCKTVPKQEPSSTPLWRHIWRSFIRSTLLPLIVLEVLLVSAFLISNTYVRKENGRTIKSLVHDELGLLVQQETKRIEQELHSIEQLAKLYQIQTEHAYYTPFTPVMKEKVRYHFSPNGAWLSEKTPDGVASFYSALTNIGKKEQEKACRLNAIDPIMADIKNSNPLITQVFLNTHDSLGKLYPYFDFIAAIGESHDLSSYNFYYAADADHNPERKVVWTEVYLDPAGQGWLTSCLAPIYKNDFLEAVVGLDVTVETIIHHILNIDIPWNGSVFFLDQKGTIIAMSSKSEHLLNLTDLTDIQKSRTQATSNTFKPEQYNIYNHHVLKNMAKQVFATKQGSSMLLLPEHRQTVGWATIAQTGWKLMVLVPEENIFAVSADLENRIQKISWFIIGGASLFTLLFFLFLYYRTRQTSMAIARPINFLEQMAEKIGNGENTERPPESGIFEIDQTSKNLILMQQKLEEKKQEIIKNSEQHINTILESANEGFWLIDNDNRTQDVNLCMCNILDRRREEIIGHSILEFVDEANKNIFLQQRANRTEKTTGTYEISLNRPDSTQISCIFHTAPLVLPGKQKLGFFAMVTDISAQKKIESALHTLFQKSADGVLLIENRQFIDCNDAIVIMMKYEHKDDLLQTHPADISPARQPDGRMSLEKADEMIQTCMDNGTNRFEWVHQKADGEDFWVDVVLTRLDMEGRTLIHAACRDISDKKTYEETLEEKNSELAVMLEQVRIAQQKSEHAAQSRSTFLANMSHEIRTPMNAIIGMTALTLETPLKPEQQHYLQIIDNSASNLLGILNDILDFSKIDAGQIDLENKDFNLDEVVESVMETMAVKAFEKEIEMLCHVDARINTALRGDQLRLRQILLNLVGNAVKFTHRGEIVLRVVPARKQSDSQKTHIHFSVSDTGPGIAQDKQEEIFNTFSQEDNSISRVHGGTGLGLSISRQLASLMGGKMWVNSQLGSGATFHFTACFSESKCIISQAFQFSVNPADYRILLVDEKETSRSLMKNLLRAWHFSVVEAPSNEKGLRESLQAYRAGAPFDLIIIDQKIASISGLELIHTIKEESGAAISRFLLLSASNHQIRGRCQDTQSCSLLLKPVKRSEFFSAISSILDSVIFDITNSKVHHDQTETVHPRTSLEVLLVEDNEANQLLATLILKREGHNVTSANNGYEALHCLQEQQFDIILMDIQMPKMDGMTAIRIIRSYEQGNPSHYVEDASLSLSLEKRLKGKHTPIVVMTAHAMVEDRQACLDTGADKYLTKPFAPKDVISIINTFSADI